MPTSHALKLDREVVGSCALDGEGQLLMFYVLPQLRDQATAWLRQVLVELEASRMIVCTLDPGFLSPAMEWASSVESHTRHPLEGAAFVGVQSFIHRTSIPLDASFTWAGRLDSGLVALGNQGRGHLFLGRLAMEDELQSRCSDTLS